MSDESQENTWEQDVLEPDASEELGASEELDALLEFLRRTRGFDFTGYKRASLERRIRRRMQTIDITSFAHYLDHLEVHPDEFPQLFNVLLINVTSFFRDQSAWDSLAARLPTLVDLGAEAQIRIWSAGCSSGEEPYTLAMLLCEALGPSAFAQRVKIYATDIDEDVLTQARQAVYSPRAVEPIPAHLLEKYFMRVGSKVVFSKALRRSVIFGSHDLVQDAPIRRIDVLACRNVLMYLNAQTQTRVLQRLKFALNPTGMLFLGKAEMLLTHGDMFSPVDLKLRLFRAGNATRDSKSFVGASSAPDPSDPHEPRAQLRRSSFEASPVAQLVIDVAGRVALSNLRANRLFSLSARDIGRPFHELELSYRPAELRSCIDKVRIERRALQLKEVERVLPDGAKTYLDIEVVPLVSQTGAFLGTHVSFADVTASHRLEHELRRANRELETAHEELQSTSEELETTNEELQSTVEELETTNEELQSTNEELETMNEELQSTNKELQTMNDELRRSGTDLNDMNAYFDGVLGSLHAGVAVLDDELRIRTWNHRMTDLWGSRPDEVEGRHLLNLDIGLPVEKIAPSLRAALVKGDEEQQTLECTNRRGKTVNCKVSVAPLRSESSAGVVVVVEEVG